MNTLPDTRAPANRGLGHVLHGHGPRRVMVLHDWLGDHTGYAPLLPWLDGSAFTYAFIDLRGYGRSMGMRGDYSLMEMAADCLELADRLEWSRFHVIGHSMTGMLTQRLAVDAPQRIASAVAVCPVSAAGNRLQGEALAFFASTTTDDAALRRLFAFVSPGLPASWVEAKLECNRRNVAASCRLPYLRTLVEADFVDEVRGLRTPFLVIIGDRDPGLDAPAMQSTFLAWHPVAELHVLGNCGHYPMQECPPRLAAVIEAFLLRQQD